MRSAPPVSDKGPVPSPPPRRSEPPPGSRVVSRYSCLSVSSFRKREREWGERQRETNRAGKKRAERQTHGQMERGGLGNEWGGRGGQRLERSRAFHSWTGEKQPQQAQLNGQNFLCWCWSSRCLKSQTGARTSKPFGKSLPFDLSEIKYF